ncbi:hypothetical protein ACFL4P_02040 [Gemmatimonadota bacterium]
MKFSGKGFALNCLSALLIALLLSAAACSDRERANPFDPQSPEYGGMGGLNAFAGNQRVYLNWGELDYDDLLGFDIIRVSLADQDTIQLNDTTLTADAVDYIDTTAENGNTYAYSLQVCLIGSDERPLTIPDLATPGRVFGWLTNENGTRVSYMTPDFRDEVYRLDGGFLEVEELQLTPNQREVWVYDFAYRQISRYDNFSGEQLEGDPVFNNTTAFVFNYQNKSLWIAYAGNTGIVRHFNSSGALAKSYQTNLEITSLAVDYLGSGVWVGSSDNKIARAGQNEVLLIDHPEFTHPEYLFSGRYSSDVWILDTGANAVFRYSNGETGKLLSGLESLTDLAVNREGTRCWVADPDADILYEINTAGNVLGTLENLERPWRLTLSPLDESVYVSGENGKISLVAPGPTVSWQMDYPSNTGKIALELRD